MKNRLAYLLFVLMLFLFGMTSSAAGKSSPAGKKTHKIIWEDPQRITKGGYPRVHRLNDGRLMMSYAKSFSNYIRFSEDNGLTWSDEENKVMSPFVVENDRGKARLDASNPEFAQLSAENPFHPGRIIFACNYRPKWFKTGVGDENMSSVHPYTIAIKTSDDGGRTWSGVRHVYRSELWKENVLRGCRSL